MSCSDEPSAYSSNWTKNPNGDSELALLMRKMYDDHYVVKEKIEAGKNFEFNSDYDRLFTADATEPEKVASPEYKAFGQAYLASLEPLSNATYDDAITAHNNAVQNCMNCHSALCPGPRVKIKKLFIK